jgi:WD40 repeat protein
MDPSDPRSLDSAQTAFSPDGSTLAVGRPGEPIELWKIVPPRRIATLGERVGASDVLRLTYSPDGKLVVFGGVDRKSLLLWDVAARRLRDRLVGHTDLILSAAFSPDGQTLATCGWDATVRLWDTGTARLRTTLRGHGGWVTDLAFTPDGRTLASSGNDHTIRLWNLVANQEVTTLPGAPFARVSFSPDGNWLAAGGGDGVLRLWRAASLAETDTPVGAPQGAAQ